MNLIKMLIFLLYNIDNKHDGFELDKTSFATIFNSNKIDDDTVLTNIGNIAQEAKDAIVAYNTSSTETSEEEEVGESRGDEELASPSSGGKKIRTQKSRRKPKKNKTR